jgi:hypothetical protein
MQNPLHFGLVVGIWRYPGGYAELQGPRNDAMAFARWLVDPDGGGLPEENVALCLSPRSGEMTLRTAEPTKVDIDLALGELRHRARDAFKALPEGERADAPASARLYVFVAGHGVMPDGGSAALLDAVARPGGTSHLDLGKYAQWLERDGTFGEVVLFADCCRNYEPLVEARGPDLDKAAQLGVRVFQLLGYATTAGTLSREDTARYDPEIPPDERRGYFSRALVEGLQGAAVHPALGHVTPQRLHEYVRSKVRERTAHRPPHQRQDVDTVVNLAHEMTFGPKRPVVRYAVTLHFPPEVTMDVELVAPDGSRMGWNAGDGPWRVRLYDGLWRVEPGQGLADDGAFAVTGADRDVHL